MEKCKRFAEKTALLSLDISVLSEDQVNEAARNYCVYAKVPDLEELGI